MKRGCINLVEGGVVETNYFPREWEEAEETLRSSVRVGQFSETLGDSARVREGTAMKEYVADTSDRYLDEDGVLEERTSVTKSVDVTDFVEVPESFVVTESTDDELAREVLGVATDGVVRQSEIDVRQFKQHEEFDLTRAATDSARDVQFVEAVEFSRAGSSLPPELQNQPNVLVGFENLRWNGMALRGVLTASGYVEVYEPDLGSETYAQFLDEVVLQYAH